MSSVMVDVNYRGLELGTGLMMSEFGPSTALIETPAPLPVGASLEITPEGGGPIAVTVIRVYEETSGATELPGMRVRAAHLGGDSATWWNGNESVADPIVPEPVGVMPAQPEPPAAEPAPAEAPGVGGATVPMAAVPDSDEAATAPRGKNKPKKRSSRKRKAESAPEAQSASDDTEVSGQAPADGAAVDEASPKDLPLKGSSTVRMSLQELKDAGIPIPDEEPQQTASSPESDTLDEPVGKKKKKRRRRKKR